VYTRASLEYGHWICEKFYLILFWLSLDISFWHAIIELFRKGMIQRKDHVMASSRNKQANELNGGNGDGIDRTGAHSIGLISFRLLTAVLSESFMGTVMLLTASFCVLPSFESTISAGGNGTRALVRLVFVRICFFVLNGVLLSMFLSMR